LAGMRLTSNNSVSGRHRSYNRGVRIAAPSKPVDGADMAVVDVASRGSQFLGRPAGARLRQWLERQFEAVDGGVVGLDLQSLELFDHGAADEAVAKLLITIRTGLVAHRCVLFLNGSDALIEHLAYVLERRHLCAVSSNRRGVRLIGKVPPGVTEVFDYVRRVRRARAAGLGEALGISTNAASNRLRLLWRSGAMTRVAVTDPLGGRAFCYQVPAGASSASRRACPSSSV
jgi:hypothetical protein